MTKYNKRGEEVLDVKLDAAAERAGKDVIFVIDQESKSLQEKILKTLEKIEKHLGKINS